MINIFSASKNDDSVVIEQAVGQLYDIYKKNLLYASPDVINAFADFMQYIYQNPTGSLDNKEYLRKLTRLFGAMREDLGLSNNELGTDQQNLLRIMITDFDSIMH